MRVSERLVALASELTSYEHVNTKASRALNKNKRSGEKKEASICAVEYK